jgi:hypothetical protein
MFHQNQILTGVNAMQNPFEAVEFAPRVIEVKRFPVAGGTWHARSDFSNNQWVPMPLFGPATFENCKSLLLKQPANRGYSIVEVL